MVGKIIKPGMDMEVRSLGMYLSVVTRFIFLSKRLVLTAILIVVL